MPIGFSGIFTGPSMAEDLAKPLLGRGVLVTRPQGQADALCDLVEGAGGRAIRFPLLEIMPMPEHAEGPDLLRDLEGWNWLIFVSSNAVRFGLACIERAGEVPAWPKVAAIGQATAEELERQGIAVDLAPKQQFNSEALLAMPELADVSGQRILIVRGAGGRETLADTLRLRGAYVAYAEVYRRSAPQNDPARLLEPWRSGEIDVVTVTSGEALDNLEAIVAAGDFERVRQMPLAVIGERVAEKARFLGYETVMAAEAGDESLLAAVIALANVRREVPIHSEHGDTALVDEEREVTQPAEEPVAVAATDASAESLEEAPPPPKKKSRVSAWVGYVILLLVFALAGGGFFILQELRTKQEGLGSGLDKGDRQMQELLHQISGFQTELAALHAQFATLQSQVSTEDTKFERQIGEQGSAFGERLDSAKSELSAAIEHIQRQMNKTRGDMMVADAEYLLGIANQKLHLTGDVKAVLAAMAAADQRLHDSGDPAVFKVREALAEEIDQLEDVKVADVVGLSAQILALETGVKALPLFLPHPEKGKETLGEVPAEKIPEQQGEGGAGGLLDSALSDFKGLVTVRRTDRPVQAVLLPEEVEALRQVLLLRMEMTRLALLRGDDGLYKASVESVLSWLKEHFDGEAASTQDLVAELNELKAQRIAVPFPDIGKSLALLRNIEKLRLEAEEKGKSEAKSEPPPEGAQP